MLQFSGGKDSLACFYLLEPYWKILTVVWVNTGASFPETIKLCDFVKANVKEFIEIKSDQPAHTKAFGLPSDVVPIRASHVGRIIEPSSRIGIQSFLDCCSANLWVPMSIALRDLGVDAVIRGQKLSDKKKSTIKSGYVENGVTYLFPLEDWSDKDVVEYLGERLPSHYEFMNTSLDCWSCTAYLSENEGKQEYMEKHHPEWASKRLEMLKTIKTEVMEDLRLYG